VFALREETSVEKYLIVGEYFGSPGWSQPIWQRPLILLMFPDPLTADNTETDLGALEVMSG
jgi:hypothetical protein